MGGPAEFKAVSINGFLPLQSFFTQGESKSTKQLHFREAELLLTSFRPHSDDRRLYE